MLTLPFKDELTTSKFSYGNEFIYDDLKRSSIRITNATREIPYVMLNTIHADNVLMFSNYHNQLRGRALTTAKLKDVMDGAKVPIKIRLGAVAYYIGKGFIGRITHEGQNKVELLFVAVVDRGQRIASTADVKFYISRNIYLESNKKLHPVLKEILAAHRGDVIISPDLDKYIGAHIQIPPGLSLKDRKEFIEAIVVRAIEKKRSARRT